MNLNQAEHVFLLSRYGWRNSYSFGKKRKTKKLGTEAFVDYSCTLVFTAHSKRTNLNYIWKTRLSWSIHKEFSNRSKLDQAISRFRKSCTSLKSSEHLMLVWSFICNRQLELKSLLNMFSDINLKISSVCHATSNFSNLFEKSSFSRKLPQISTNSKNRKLQL